MTELQLKNWINTQDEIIVYLIGQKNEPNAPLNTETMLEMAYHVKRYLKARLEEMDCGCEPPPDFMQPDIEEKDPSDLI